MDHDDTTSSDPKTEPRPLGERLAALAAGLAHQALDSQELDWVLVGGLCELACAADPTMSDLATTALYTRAVERLCDDFSQAGVWATNRLLACLIQEVRRRLPWGQELDRRLAEHGLASPAQLVERCELLARPRPVENRHRVERCLVLSRVTIGADIAITSVLLQRLAAAFPAAELVLVAPRKQAQLFGGWPRLSLVPMEYPRGGGLAARLGQWPALHDQVRLLAGSAPDDGRTLLFDPDSRLTQLGLLPALHADCTRLFPSRQALPGLLGPSLSALANDWLDSVLGPGPFAWPAVWLAPEDQARAAAFRSRLTAAGCRHLVVVNLGVGGNDRKRVAGDFEAQLVCGLARMRPDTVVVLDCGAGDEGVARCRLVLDEAAGQGLASCLVREAEILERLPVQGCGVIGVQGSLATVAGLINVADGFLGYDSACGHLAAALARPAVTIFAGAPHRRFIERWQPLSRAAGQTLVAEPEMAPAALVGQVETAMATVLAAAAGSRP
ncbi:MAG: glycosyltransferase family 9 protein [Thermodesulfobacteriota bacterium]